LSSAISNWPRVGAEIGLDGDIRRQNQPQEAAGFDDRAVDVEIGGVERLATRIRQELQDYAGRLLDRRLRAVEQRLRRVGGRDLLVQRFEIEIDRQQHVVELMRDAAGDLSQRLKVLGLAEPVVLAATRSRQEWHDPINLAHHITSNGDGQRHADHAFQSF